MSEDVDMVEVPGSEGIFGVLPGHAPFMSTLAPGVLKVKNGSDERRIFVRGGFAEVNPDGLTILAEEAIPVADLDAKMILERIKHAEEDVADKDASDATRQRAGKELAELKDLQGAM